VLALLALPASAAFGASEFSAERFPPTISGEQAEGNHVVTVEDEKSLSCEKATFGGELSAPAATLTVSPSYSGCTFGGKTATVTTNSCTYKLHGGEEVGETETKFEGTLDVVCPEGQKIAVATSNCEFKIGTQSGVGKLEFVDHPEATPKENYTVNISLTKLKYSKTVDGTECPLTGVGEKEDGAYSGHELIKGSRSSEGVGVAVLKVVKVKLCKEDPKKVACKNAYPAKETLEATNSEDIVFIHSATSITCTTSKITAATKAEAETPLNLENFATTFAGCTESKMNCTKVEMTGTPTAAIYQWGGGNGSIVASATLFFECPGFVCQFASPTLTMPLFGGMAPEILVVAQSFAKQKIGTEKNCEGVITWSTGKYAVGKPKELWVSR
jgi:hypothetical protein